MYLYHFWIQTTTNADEDDLVNKIKILRMGDKLRSIRRSFKIRIFENFAIFKKKSDSPIILIYNNDLVTNLN